MDANGRDWLGQARRGVIEMCVLMLLDNSASYGYELVKALGAWDALATPEGTVYPLLARMVRLGYIAGSFQESSQGPVRRYYHLTAVGREVLQQQLAEWQALTHAVSEIYGFKYEDKGVPDAPRRRNTLPRPVETPSGAPAGD